MKAASWLPLLQGSADQAERIALRLFHKADLRAEQKQDSSPVTEVGQATEKMTRELARRGDPRHSNQGPVCVAG
jgi:fructose-1,6-bisphosphatase/inositol monophosphatase family enzyme